MLLELCKLYLSLQYFDLTKELAVFLASKCGGYLK